jgi:hypothetical protein
VARKATEELNAARFGLSALDTADLNRLFALLRTLRLHADDFVEA